MQESKIELKEWAVEVNGKLVRRYKVAVKGYDGRKRYIKSRYNGAFTFTTDPLYARAYTLGTIVKLFKNYDLEMEASK